VKLRSAGRRHRTALTAAGAIALAAALVLALAGDRAEFAAALDAASVWILLIAGGLQVLWLALRRRTP
jgi:hypothetical protein